MSCSLIIPNNFDEAESTTGSTDIADCLSSINFNASPSDISGLATKIFIHNYPLSNFKAKFS